MLQEQERRVRRTEQPDQAVQYFLETARLRLGLKALVLADRQGHLVAAATEEVDPETAAKAAPRIFDRDEPFPADEPDSYFVEVLPSGRGSLFLLAMGQVSPHTLKASGTLAGIRRILDM